MASVGGFWYRQYSSAGPLDDCWWCVTGSKWDVLAGALEPPAGPLFRGGKGRATGRAGCLTGTAIITGGDAVGNGAYMCVEDHVACLGSWWVVGGERGICLALRGEGVIPGCTGEKAEAREVESWESCCAFFRGESTVR